MSVSEGGCLTVRGYNCRLSVKVIVRQFIFLDARRLSSLKRNMCKITKSAMFSQSLPLIQFRSSVRRRCGLPLPYCNENMKTSYIGHTIVHILFVFCSDCVLCIEAKFFDPV